jgi:hypothetical protein
MKVLVVLNKASLNALAEHSPGKFGPSIPLNQQHEVVLLDDEVITDLARLYPQCETLDLAVLKLAR